MMGERGLDTDALQADVMRFMAIIAFCLIAIMMLVKDLPVASPDNPVMPDSSRVAIQMPQADPVTPPVIEQLPADSSQTVVETKPAVSASPIVETASDPAKQLTLQFASDRAFMQLIAENLIQLYARNSGQFVQLNQDFSIEPADVEGELYEVMGKSLPAVVMKLFSSADLFLVRLPGDTMTEVKSMYTSHAESGGKLLIDSTGGVRYEAPGQ